MDDEHHEQPTYEQGGSFEDAAREVQQVEFGDDEGSQRGAGGGEGGGRDDEENRGGGEVEGANPPLPPPPPFQRQEQHTSVVAADPHLYVDPYQYLNGWLQQDVLCEEGVAFLQSHNPGNQQFVQVVEVHVPRYVAAVTPGHRQAIIGSIVFEIQQRGSRFMKRSFAPIEEATAFPQRHWCMMTEIQEIHTTIEHALQHIIAQHPDRYQQQQVAASSSVAATTATALSSPPVVLRTTIAASKNTTIGERWSAVKQQLLPHHTTTMSGPSVMGMTATTATLPVVTTMRTALPAAATPMTNNNNNPTTKETAATTIVPGAVQDSILPSFPIASADTPTDKEEEAEQQQQQQPAEPTPNADVERERADEDVDGAAAVVAGAVAGEQEEFGGGTNALLLAKIAPKTAASSSLAVSSSSGGPSRPTRNGSIIGTYTGHYHASSAPHAEQTALDEDRGRGRGRTEENDDDAVAVEGFLLSRPSRKGSLIGTDTGHDQSAHNNNNNRNDNMDPVQQQPTATSDCSNNNATVRTSPVKQGAVGAATTVDAIAGPLAFPIIEQKDESITMSSVSAPLASPSPSPATTIELPAKEESNVVHNALDKDTTRNNTAAIVLPAATSSSLVGTTTTEEIITTVDAATTATATPLSPEGRLKDNEDAIATPGSSDSDAAVAALASETVTATTAATPIPSETIPMNTHNEDTVAAATNAVMDASQPTSPSSPGNNPIDSSSSSEVPAFLNGTSADDDATTMAAVTVTATTSTDLASTAVDAAILSLSSANKKREDETDTTASKNTVHASLSFNTVTNANTRTTDATAAVAATMAANRGVKRKSVAIKELQPYLTDTDSRAFGSPSESKRRRSSVQREEKSMATAAMGSPPKPTAAKEAGKDISPAVPYPVPVMRGTLCYSAGEPRQHVIIGTWNFENTTLFPDQNFELIRNLPDDEPDGSLLPKNGTFNGSFTLMYNHTTSFTTKTWVRTKKVKESHVKIKFTKTVSSKGEDRNDYNVDGIGVNSFGIFLINGTAKPTVSKNEGQYDMELRKRYDAMCVVGATISKPFDGVDYAGKIMSYDIKTSYYKAQYDDGDEEELYSHEVMRYHVRNGNVDMAIKKKTTKSQASQKLGKISQRRLTGKSSGQAQTQTSRKRKDQSQQSQGIDNQHPVKEKTTSQAQTQKPRKRNDQSQRSQEIDNSPYSTPVRFSEIDPNAVKCPLPTCEELIMEISKIVNDVVIKSMTYGLTPLSPPPSSNGSSVGDDESEMVQTFTKLCEWIRLYDARFLQDLLDSGAIFHLILYLKHNVRDLYHVDLIARILSHLVYAVRTITPQRGTQTKNDTTVLRRVTSETTKMIVKRKGIKYFLQANEYSTNTLWQRESNQNGTTGWILNYKYQDIQALNSIWRLIRVVSHDPTTTNTTSIDEITTLLSSAISTLGIVGKIICDIEVTSGRKQNAAATDDGNDGDRKIKCRAIASQVLIHILETLHNVIKNYPSIETESSFRQNHKSILQECVNALMLPQNQVLSEDQYGHHTDKVLAAAKGLFMTVFVTFQLGASKEEFYFFNFESVLPFFVQFIRRSTKVPLLPKSTTTGGKSDSCSSFFQVIEMISSNGIIDKSKLLEQHDVASALHSVLTSSNTNADVKTRAQKLMRSLGGSDRKQNYVISL